MNLSYYVNLISSIMITPITPNTSLLSNNNKVKALETSLQQSFVHFKDLLIDFEQLHIESESYKTKFITQKEKCESKCCDSSETLKKIIESKDNIIQLVASTLTRLNETKNFSILNEAFKILFSETSVVKLQSNDEKPLISPHKAQNLSTDNVSFKDESVSEIEGTPTGRTSPIIQSKKLKSLLVTSSDYRDKKKCPESWVTPEKKSLKLTYPTPTRGKSNGRLKQSRLNIVKSKHSYVVDLTSSPEFSGGSGTIRSDSDNNVQPLIKKESIETEDTILPSPTSGPNEFTLFKSKTDSPIKFKRPLSLKVKNENVSKVDSKLNQENIDNSNIETKTIEFQHEDDSINLLNPNRLPNNIVNNMIKQEHYGNDTTYCDTQASISLLHNVKKLDVINADIKQPDPCSPSKQPLAENINITNVPDYNDMESSILLLPREPKASTGNNVKRKIAEPVEIVYKEPAPRKKAEKRLLPGWSCDECKHFFGELYKDDPELYARKLDECSKHRGNHNPARPKTPPGFWNPRWEVPDDTEQFNRKNNVA